jgi:hypothetical protein
MCAGGETLLTTSSELRQGGLMAGQLIVEREVISIIAHASTERDTAHHGERGMNTPSADDDEYEPL